MQQTETTFILGSTDAQTTPSTGAQTWKGTGPSTSGVLKPEMALLGMLTLKKPRPAEGTKE